MNDDVRGQSSPSGEHIKTMFNIIANGKVQRLSSLLARGADIEVRDGRMRTPIIQATFIPKSDVRAHVIRLLLRYGCDVNAQDGDGRNALMYTCMEMEKVDSVRLLIRCKKCDPNLQDSDGYTAFMHAAVNRNTTAIRVLTNHANTKSVLRVDSLNKQGLSALELAVKLRLADVCRVLVQEGCADTCTKEKQALFDIIRDGSRANSSFGYQPSLISPRYVMSPRPLGTPIHQTPVRVSPFLRPSSDIYRRMLLTPSGEMTPPLPARGQNTSSLYQRLLNSPPHQFPISPRDIITHAHGIPQIDFLQRASSRRPLTPITPRNVAPHKSPSPLTVIPHPNRLPSIPSGKRMYILDPTDTPK